VNCNRTAVIECWSVRPCLSVSDIPSGIQIRQVTSNKPVACLLPVVENIPTDEDVSFNLPVIIQSIQELTKYMGSVQIHVLSTFSCNIWKKLKCCIMKILFDNVFHKNHQKKKKNVNDDTLLNMMSEWMIMVKWKKISVLGDAE